MEAEIDARQAAAPLPERSVCNTNQWRLSRYAVRWFTALPV